MAIQVDGNIGKDPNSSTSQDINTPDIDGGTIDGADITVGAGKTLDVSAGTLKPQTIENTTLSGEPKVVVIYINNTPYYFKVYPVKE